MLSLIARMDPDPDMIRSANFGIDEGKYRLLLTTLGHSSGFPEELLQLALRCCSSYAVDRPDFETVHSALTLLSLRQSFKTMATV